MTACRSCGAEVRWVVTAATGSRMPVDAQPTDDGTLLLSAGDPPVATVIPRGQLTIDDGLRFTSHYATCPDADRWRKRRTT